MLDAFVCLRVFLCMCKRDKENVRVCEREKRKWKREKEGGREGFSFSFLIVPDFSIHLRNLDFHTNFLQLTDTDTRKR